MQTDVVVFREFAIVFRVLAVVIVAGLVAMIVFIVRNRAWSSAAIGALVGVPLSLFLIRFVRLQDGGRYYTVASILFLAVVTALIVGFVFIVRHAPRSGVAIGALVAVPSFLMALSLVAYRDVARPAVITSNRQPLRALPLRLDAESLQGNVFENLFADDETKQPPVAWRVEVDEQFVPDKYASYEMAQQALARHVKPLLLEALHSQTGQERPDDSHRIVIQNDEQKPVDHSVLDALQASLTQEFPETPVLVADNSPEKIAEQSEDENRFDVGVAMPRSPDKPVWGEAGEIAVEVRGPIGSCTENIPYVNSSWVYGQVVDNQYARVRTEEFVSSPDQAETEVREATVETLAELFPRYPVTHKLTKGIDVRKEIRRSLRDLDDIFVDQFTQQLKMDSGDIVCRSAALIDMSRVEPMFTAIVEKHQPRKNVRTVTRHRKKSFWGGLTGLLLGVAGVFFGLRIITQRMTESRMVAADSQLR